MATAITNVETNIGDCATCITTVETTQSTQGEGIQKQKEVMGNFESKLDQMMNMVEHQQVLIKELSEKNATLHTKIYDSNSSMLLTGIPKKRREDCTAVLKAFFTRVMKITQDVPITKAFRVGGESSNAILFYLAHPSLKGLLFKHISNLKGIKGQNGDYFNLKETLTGEESERQ